MASDLVVRVDGAGDVGAIASLRSLWIADAGADPEFERRMDAWLHRRGRTPHDLARHARRLAGRHGVRARVPADAAPGTPDSRWGYVSNMFVREDLRNRGIGSALLTAIIAAADERSYARLVLSPSAQSLPFYRRAGFVVPDKQAGDDRLLVRARRAG